MANVEAKSDRVFEQFNLPIFIVGFLIAAFMLLAVPIGIVFHPVALWYTAEFGTAAFFVAIYMMTAHRLFG